MLAKIAKAHLGKLSGIALMIVGMFFFSTMDAIAKWLMEHSATSVQLLALRSIVIAPCLILFFWLNGAKSELMPTRPVAQGVRGILGFIAPFCFFTGLQYLPLAAAVVVFFSSILFTTLLSTIVLKEKVGIQRWLAVVLGYCGVALAMMPWSGGDLKGYLLVLISSITYSLLFITGKILAKTESVTSLVLSFNLGVGTLSLLLLPWFWQDIAPEMYFGVLLLSIFAVSGSFAITKAFSIAEASKIAPFEYTGVLWAVLFDIAIWRVYPSEYTVMGALLIIGSSLYVIRREHVRST